MNSLEIDANLVAVSEESSVCFHASGKSGVLTLSNANIAASLLDLIPLSTRSRKNLRMLHSGCSSQEITLDVEVAGRLLMRVGHQCRPGLFSRLLRVFPVEVRGLSLIAVFLSAAAGRRGNHR